MSLTPSSPKDSPVPLNPERTTVLLKRFAAEFGGAPTVWARAPGRVDLMGSHTDYNKGMVMTMTLDRDTWAAARPRADGRVSVWSLNAESGSNFDLNDLQKDLNAPWSNYVRAVAWALQDAGHVLSGFDAVIHSTLPLGSGLSSSAALELVTALIFQHLSGIQMGAVDTALLAQRAENEFVGVNCGILDQYSSALGQSGCALLLDCRDLSSRAVPIAPELQLVIGDTRAPRQLLGSEYDERREQCRVGAEFFCQLDPALRSLRDVSPALFEAQRHHLPPLVARRCQFIIEENARVSRLAQALPRGDQSDLHELFEASYLGARDLYQITVPAMDTMWQTMLGSPGVVGARQAGAGFGGCLVALVEKAQVEAFSQHVREDYAAHTGIQARVYPVQASPGAGIMNLG